MAGIDIRLPSITGRTDKERIEQLRMYLIYLVEQLQYILGNLDEANLTEGFSRRVTDGSGSESVYKQLAEGFSQVVRKNNVISSINQTAEMIEIIAAKLNLNGYTNINGGFNIDEDGNAILTGGSDISLVSTGDDVAKFSIANEGKTKTVTISPSYIVIEDAEFGKVELGGEGGAKITALNNTYTASSANLHVDVDGNIRRVAPIAAQTPLETFESPVALYDVSVKQFDGSGYGIQTGDIMAAFPEMVGDDGYVNYTSLVPALLALLQEQNERIKALEGA